MESSSPWVEIVKQPPDQMRFYREDPEIANYRVIRSAFPEIKVHGYSGRYVAVASCVTETEPYKPHPNTLIGLQCKKGVCSLKVVRKSNSSLVFPCLLIHKARKRDFESRMKKRKSVNVDPYQTGFEFKERDIDLTVVRLCFQVFLPDDQGKMTRVVPPVVSQPICDEKHGDRTRGSSLKKHLYQQVEEQSEMCDVTVQVGTWTRRYHWNILCVLPFFARLYASRLKEHQTGIINLSIGSSNSVQNALDFLYGVEPDVELHTAYNLMETADFLMLDELKNICEKKVLSFNVSSESCLTLLFIGSRFDINIPKLEDFYLSHLPELMKQDQMLKIDKEAVRLLFTDQTLSYIGKDNIIKFLVRWAALSPNRKSDFREMLSYLENDDFSDEILKTVHDAYPDLESTIFEAHPGLHLLNSDNHVTKINNRCDVFVLYPPDKKFETIIFYVFSLKHKCWFKIPMQSDDFERGSKSLAHGIDTILTLNMCSETISIFDLTCGQSNEKKLKFQDGAYVLAFDVPLAISGETIYIAKNFHNIVLNTNVESTSYDEGPPDLIKVETSTMVYASVELEKPEITMDPLFSIDIQVDKMCVAEDLLCLLSQKSHQLVVYCLQKKIRAVVKLPPCCLVDKDGILTTSGSHVYILVDNYIMDIEFEISSENILWKAQTIFPNEVFYSSVLSSCQLTQEKIVMQTKDDKRQHLMLKWQGIGSTNYDESTEKVYEIDIPEKLPFTDEHRLMQLQLPKEALKCHIDCPHCKDNETESFDLFSYQQSFSSGEESTDEQLGVWSDEDPSGESEDPFDEDTFDEDPDNDWGFY